MNHFSSSCLLNCSHRFIFVAKHTFHISIWVASKKRTFLAQPGTLRQTLNAIALLMDRHITPITIHNLIGILADTVQAHHAHIIAVVDLHLPLLRLLITVHLVRHLLQRVDDHLKLVLHERPLPLPLVVPLQPLDVLGVHKVVHGHPARLGVAGHVVHVVIRSVEGSARHIGVKHLFWGKFAEFGGEKIVSARQFGFDCCNLVLVFILLNDNNKYDI